MHHSSFCAHCLKSLVTPDKALPDIFPKKYSLPLTDKFWPPIEVHTCETCKIEVSFFFSSLLYFVSF